MGSPSATWDCLGLLGLPRSTSDWATWGYFGYLGYLGFTVAVVTVAVLAAVAAAHHFFSQGPNHASTTSSHRGEPRDNQFFSQGSNDAITTSLGGVTGGDRSFRPRADLFIVRISTACLPIRYAKSSVSPTLLPQPSDGVDDHFKITRMPFPLVPVRVDVLRKL